MPKNAKKAKPKAATKRNKTKTSGAMVAAPAATSYRGTSQRPTWTAKANGTVGIKHREQFAEVFRPNDLADYQQIFSHRINPGNSQIFPWLAGIAPSWETYQFNTLRFEYIPSAPSTAAGTVTISVDYDPEDSVPTTKQQLLQMDGSTTAGLWVKQTHSSTRGNLQKRKELFVATGGPADRLNDTGTAIFGIFGTDGDPTRASTGDLWVTYDVTLFTPQPRNPVNTELSYSGTFTMLAGDPATDFARAYVFEDMADGTIAPTTVGEQGEAAFISPIGLTFPQPGDYAIELLLLAGPLGTDGSYVDGTEESGLCLFSPATILDTQPGIVNYQMPGMVNTPNFDYTVTGARYFRTEANVTTFSPYSAFTFTAAAIPTLCGVLYVRAWRNNFLNTIPPNTALPS